MICKFIVPRCIPNAAQALMWFWIVTVPLERLFWRTERNCGNVAVPWMLGWLTCVCV